MRRPRLILLLPVIALISMAACANRIPDPVVDGWPIGDAADCSDRPWECDLMIEEARAGLGRRDPGHAAIVAATLHSEGTTIGSDGGQVIHTRSGGCCSVARFELADGSVAAVGIGYPGISDTLVTVDYGP